MKKVRANLSIWTLISVLKWVMSVHYFKSTSIFLHSSHFLWSLGVLPWLQYQLFGSPARFWVCWPIKTYSSLMASVRQSNSVSGPSSLKTQYWKIILWWAVSILHDDGHSNLICLPLRFTEVDRSLIFNTVEWGACIGFLCIKCRLSRPWPYPLAIDFFHWENSFIQNQIKVFESPSRNIGFILGWPSLARPHQSSTVST